MEKKEITERREKLEWWYAYITYMSDAMNLFCNYIGVIRVQLLYRFGMFFYSSLFLNITCIRNYYYYCCYCYYSFVCFWTSDIQVY